MVMQQRGGSAIRRHLHTTIVLLGGLLLGRVVPAAAQLQGQTIRIAIGTPLTGGAASFGIEMKNAVELAVEEQNAAGGVLGARVEARVAEDEASDAKGQAVATGFCGDPAVLAGVGHVTSTVGTACSSGRAGW